MLFALAAVAAATACAVAIAATRSSAPARDRTPPAPDAALPREAGALAERLTETTGALRESIAAWRAGGSVRRGDPPRAVILHALHWQRIFRLLAVRPRLAAATLRRLPRWLSPTARDITGALRSLARLNPPTRRRRFRTGRAQPAGILLDHYRRAQRRFRVSWRILAAVNLVETGFNRLRNNSTAGAQGPMQFIPSTWRAYGMGGDVHDPRDAIHGAANYLRASGAPRSYRRALYAYNPSTLYVNAVLRYARRIRRTRWMYLALYNWQIFVRTPSGDRRLTGPGRRH